MGGQGGTVPSGVRKIDAFTMCEIKKKKQKNKKTLDFVIWFGSHVIVLSKVVFGPQISKDDVATSPTHQMKMWYGDWRQLYTLWGHLQLMPFWSKYISSQ